MLFDAAAAAEHSLPAHAHCDLLGIEASVDGRRLIVDGGVHDYGDTKMRRYCKGTESHNAFMIDQTDQFDVWSRFRMGYRGHPSKLRTNNDRNFHWASATHNAYRRLGADTVGRWLACRDGGPWICIDWALGDGRHDTCDRLRFHPDVEITQTGEREFAVSVGSLTLGLQYYFEDGTVELEDGIYCPDFGIQQPVKVATWRSRQRLPAVVGWILNWPDAQTMYRLDVSGSVESLLHNTDGELHSLDVRGSGS